MRSLVCIVFCFISIISFIFLIMFRYSIVEGDHVLWKGVSKPYRETIRSFLVYFQNQVISMKQTEAISKC
jgi:hypothetical protein